MGKVYSWEKIEKNEIPEVSDFLFAKKQMLEGVSQLTNEGLLYGGRVFGSVAKGTPSIRSDFDILIVYTKREAQYGLQHLVSQVKRDTRVEVEPVVLDERLARQGIHTIDKPFLHHFLATPLEGNVGGNDPISILQPQLRDVPKTHIEYAGQKIRRLSEGFYPQTPDQKIKVLQRALEAPVNVGRRTLDAFQELGCIQMETDDDSKEAVVVNYRTHAEKISDSNHLWLFNNLLNADRQYSRFLSDALGGLRSQHEYEKYVENLWRVCVPIAQEWVQEISLSYHRKLDETRKEGQEALPRRRTVEK